VVVAVCLFVVVVMVCTELSWWFTGDDGGIDVVTTKLAPVSSSGIVGDCDVVTLAVSVVFSRCRGLWNANRSFDVA
jgi:hypothetical protein